MKELTKFKAIYASGLVIPNPAAVTALSLIFESIYIPNNIEVVCEFSKKYSFVNNENITVPEIAVEAQDGSDSDPFIGLNDKQRKTALIYLDWGMKFSLHYQSLYDGVFETNVFESGHPLDAKLIKEGKNGELNTYEVSKRPMRLVEGDNETFPNLINRGYIPVITDFKSANRKSRKLDDITAKELASILAMKSVEMLFPPTRGVQPDLILQARHKLSDQLPPFWSAMFKLTKDLKNLIKDCSSESELFKEGIFLVDTVVRPALIDLTSKMEKERKDWFYKILSPIQKGLRVLVGNPPVTQQQLITSALVLGSDVAMSTAENMRTIENLKSEAGLTYLLDLSKLINRSG